MIRKDLQYQERIAEENSLEGIILHFEVFLFSQKIVFVVYIEELFGERSDRETLLDIPHPQTVEQLGVIVYIEYSGYLVFGGFCIFWKFWWEDSGIWLLLYGRIDHFSDYHETISSVN